MCKVSFGTNPFRIYLFLIFFFFFFPNDSKPSEGQIEKKKKKTFPAALGTKNDRSVVSLTIQSIGLIFALLSKA